MQLGSLARKLQFIWSYLWAQALKQIILKVIIELLLILGIKKPKFLNYKYQIIMMSKVTKLEEYKFFKEDRTLQELLITNRLTQLLTDANLRRVSQYPKQAKTSKTLRKQDFLYVCLNGFPPFQNQFQTLNLPGESIEYRFELKFNSTDQEQSFSFRKEAAKVHAKIQATSKTKPFVFVTHSFGSYLLTSYISHYPSERIIGIIQIGGIPIRAYPIIYQLIAYFKDYTPKQLVNSFDEVYKDYKLGGQAGIAFPAMPNKNTDRQILLAFFLLLINGQPFKDMFERMRNWPNVLKCFIYGREDHVMLESLLSQKATYYSYQKKFEENYDSRLKQGWQRVYGAKSDNIQQRFVFNIEKGRHSLHVQKKFSKILPKIVDQYLSFLENVLSFSSSKL